MLLLLGSLVLLTTLLTELAARRDWLPYWITRKILHVVAVGACAVATLALDRTLFTWIVAGVEVLLVFLVLNNQLLREESGRRPWGIVLFPLALLVLLLLVEDSHVVAFAMLVLAACDPAATVAGKLLARDTYQLTGDAKSLEGNAGFLAAFLVLMAAHWPFGFHLGIGNLFLIGIVLAVGEALGSKGLDNLIVPLLAAFLFERLPFVPNYYLLALVAGAIPFCWWMVRRRSLTPGGALTAALLGLVVVVGTGSPWWLLPLVLFLGTSSLIAKLLPSGAAAGDVKHGAARDATQVLANGGLYGLVAILGTTAIVDQENFGHHLYPSGELLWVIMAVATADTWSSEIGQYFRRPAYDILRWRRVPVGLSGGVSGVGSLAGLLGAVLIGTAAYFVGGGAEVTVGEGIESVAGDGSRSWKLPALVVLLGFVGMLLDSLLGSWLQATYRNPGTGELTDRAGPDFPLVSGYAWATNDLINFLAIGLTAALAYLLW